MTDELEEAACTSKEAREQLKDFEDVHAEMLYEEDMKKIERGEAELTPWEGAKPRRSGAKADKGLGKLPIEVQERIDEAIDALADDLTRQASASFISGRAKESGWETTVRGRARRRARSSPGPSGALATRSCSDHSTRLEACKKTGVPQDPGRSPMGPRDG